MSFFTELIDIYNDNIGQTDPQDDSNSSMVPVAHTPINADLQIDISAKGKFQGAELIKEETIVPFTKLRTRTIYPWPIDDNLENIARDFYQLDEKERNQQLVKSSSNNKASVEKKIKNDIKKEKENYQQHVALLESFNKFVHENNYADDLKNELSAIYHYITTEDLIHDLISANTFENKISIADLAKKKARINVRGFNEHWHDKNMFKAWADFYENQKEASKESLGVDFISGQSSVPIESNHQNKILRNAARAKLISSNDKLNFTFRGRFISAEEAATIGYESSNKAHSALRWLVDRQGVRVDSRYFLAWATNYIPKRGIPDEDDLASAMAQAVTQGPTVDKNTGLAFKKKLLQGKNIDLDSSFYILELDSATTGRLDVVYYQTMDMNLYLDKLNAWYEKTHIAHPSSQYSFNFPTLREIAGLVHREKNITNTKKKVIKSTVSDLVSLLLGNQIIPNKILIPLYNRAIRPLGFSKDEKYATWNRVLEVSASMFRVNDPVLRPALQEDLFDRGYLFGRLLAVAHETELDALREKGRHTENHFTNAQRYMAKMPADPIGAWKTVYTRLAPYLNDYQFAARTRAIINQISNQLVDNQQAYDQLHKPFTLQEKGRFIVGFVHQKNAWYGHLSATPAETNLLPELADREYLFGRLLAIADSVERQAQKNKAENQAKPIVTNADRYLNAFIQHPLNTWKQLFLSLQPYIARNESLRWSIKEIDHITNLLDTHNSTSRNLNQPLQGQFLIAYSHEKARSFGKHPKDKTTPITLNAYSADRDYLYGRLLAMADVVEYREQVIHHIKRPTTALRYIFAFSQRPATTWATIWQNVKRYLFKQGKYETEAQQAIDQIMTQIQALPNFEVKKNYPLNGEFLIGMSQQKAAWYNRNKERN